MQPINLLGVPNGYTGQGATIVNNVIDGNSVDIGGLGLIATSRGGTFVIPYNLLENAGSDLIDAGADTLASGVATTYDVRYNVLKNAGQQTSGHPDWFQTFATTTTITLRSITIRSFKQVIRPTAGHKDLPWMATPTPRWQHLTVAAYRTIR